MLLRIYYRGSVYFIDLNFFLAQNFSYSTIYCLKCCPRYTQTNKKKVNNFFFYVQMAFLSSKIPPKYTAYICL